MSKKLIIIISLVLILAGGLATGWYFIKGKKDSNLEINLPQNIISEKEKVEADLTYEDSAGFSFKYPKELKVSDNTPEDDLHYSLLSLTKGGKEIVITVKDTKSKDVDSWIKESEEYVSASLEGATTLGNISAKQYKKNSILITLAIDKGVLYLIEGEKDGGFWEDSQNVIVSSFSFSGSTPKPASGGGAVIYEEEEIVE